MPLGKEIKKEVLLKCLTKKKEIQMGREPLLESILAGNSFSLPS